MDKKKILLLLVTVLFFGIIHAQDDTPIDSTLFTVGYDFRINTKNVDGEPVTDSLRTVVLVGHNYIQTRGYSSYWTTIDGETHETFDQMMIENLMHTPIIMRKTTETEMTVYEDIPVHHYVYTEDGTLKWDLLDDTLTVSGYLCKKAQTRYGGRTWTAWYTEEVATTAGPWKLQGLPGLIVKASDENSIFSFTLFELTNKKVPIKSDWTVEGRGDLPPVKIKREKFIARRNKLFMNPRYMTEPLYYHQQSDTDYRCWSLFSIEESRNPDGSIPMDVLTMYINGVAVPRNCNEYQPLELE